MTAALGEYLSLIDELLAPPFPETEADDANGYGGPHYRVGVLWTSQDFRDDEDGQAWREAEADARARLDALIATLTPRWGAPVEIDLWPYLKAGLAGEEVPEPLCSLSRKASARRYGRSGIATAGSRSPWGRRTRNCLSDCWSRSAGSLDST